VKLALGLFLGQADWNVAVLGEHDPNLDSVISNEIENRVDQFNVAILQRTVDARPFDLASETKLPLLGEKQTGDRL
jgi:hypothetical protein